MKKIIVFATVALLMSGAAFAGNGKKCGTKQCCNKEKSAKETKEVKAAKAAKVAKVAA